MTVALALDPQPAAGGTVIPKTDYAATMRVFSTVIWPAVKEIFETALGGAPIVVPSGREDLLSPELRPLIDRFYRGTGVPAVERIKLFKLVWDAIGTEFGGRHELYERNYAGNNEQVRLDALKFATRTGELDRCVALVEQCLADYDLEGWRNDTWR
jgi:aromatic ring hydroxylase